MAFDFGAQQQQYAAWPAEAMGYPCYPGLPPPKAVLQQMGLPVSAPARSRKRGGAASYAHYPHYPPPSADAAGPVADAAGHASPWQHQQQYYQPRHRGGQWQRHGQQRHYQQQSAHSQRNNRQQDDGPYYKPTFIEDPWAPFLGKGKTLTHEDTWYKPSFVQDPWLNLLP